MYEHFKLKVDAYVHIIILNMVSSLSIIIQNCTNSLRLIHCSLSILLYVLRMNGGAQTGQFDMTRQNINQLLFTGDTYTLREEHL